MRFGRNVVSHFNGRDLFPHVYDFTGDLVTHNLWGFDSMGGPIVPFVNVDIGSAYGTGNDFDQDFVRPNGGNGRGSPFGSKLWFGFDDCIHCGRTHENSLSGEEL
jgi:hypothetical protein